MMIAGRIKSMQSKDFVAQQVHAIPFSNLICHATCRCFDLATFIFPNIGHQLYSIYEEMPDFDGYYDALCKIMDG